MWTGPVIINRLIDHFTANPGIRVKPDWLTLWPIELRPWPIDGHLLVHCRAKADGTAIRHLCDERGWSKSTDYRGVIRESRLVAHSLN